ncbi:uncharacterized protein LOC144178540 [Haemaphysalis longicornis]
MDANYLLEILSSNGTRNVSRLLSFDSSAVKQNVSFQNLATEAQQLIKAFPEGFTGKHPNNVAGRRHDDFGAAGPVVVMLGCLFLIFLAVGIPTFIQKKRREAKERREAAMHGLALRVPAIDG